MEIDSFDLEEVVDDIKGVADILLEVGCGDRSSPYIKICGYLGERLYEHRQVLDELLHDDDEEEKAAAE